MFYVEMAVVQPVVQKLPCPQRVDMPPDLYPMSPQALSSPDFSSIGKLMYQFPHCRNRMSSDVFNNKQDNSLGSVSFLGISWPRSCLVFSYQFFITTYLSSNKDVTNIY